eukprot:gene39371-48657_t
MRHAHPVLAFEQLGFHAGVTTQVQRLGQSIDRCWRGGCLLSHFFDGQRRGPERVTQDKVRHFERDGDVGIAYGMGLTAEKVAQQWKVGRDAQDAFALASHQKALAAQQAGYFADEITPIEVTDRTANLETGEAIAKTRTTPTACKACVRATGCATAGCCSTP